MRTGLLECIRAASPPRELFLLRLRSVEWHRASADTRRKWDRAIIRRRLDLADAERICEAQNAGAVPRRNDVGTSPLLGQKLEENETVH